MKKMCIYLSSRPLHLNYLHTHKHTHAAPIYISTTIMLLAEIETNSLMRFFSIKSFSNEYHYYHSYASIVTQASKRSHSHTTCTYTYHIFEYKTATIRSRLVIKRTAVTQQSAQDTQMHDSLS